MTTIKASDRFDQPITDDVLVKAKERGYRRRQSGMHATKVLFLEEFHSLLIGFADDSAVMLPVDKYPELTSLTRGELRQLEIGYAGNALCLEARDLHISIAGLVAASQPLMDMAVSLVAAQNGSRSTPAKADASRANGQKGGRPRKSATTEPRIP
ncbi:DUF2442 domain-containing protein [Pseudomonas putida]